MQPVGRGWGGHPKEELLRKSSSSVGKGKRKRNGSTLCQIGIDVLAKNKEGG